MTTWTDLADLHRRMTIAWLRYRMRSMESRSTDADVWAAWLDYRRAALVFGDVYGWGAVDDPVDHEA